MSGHKGCLLSWVVWEPVLNVHRIPLSRVSGAVVKGLPRRWDWDCQGGDPLEGPSQQVGNLKMWFASAFSPEGLL